MRKTRPPIPCTPENVGVLCRELGFDFSHEQHALLTAYLALLVKWNRVMNLVGRPDWPEILVELAADSFYLADFLRSLDIPPDPECWDLGAGAGLPGIPLRMLWREGSYTLVESREKRAIFLRTVLAACPLPGVSVFQGRAESFMPSRPLADLVVSRAFMPWEKVLDLVQNFVAPRAHCVFLTLEPMPESPPQGWTAVADTRYTAGGDARFFWALQRV